MPEANKEEAYRTVYERYAVGGRSRAAAAKRLKNGTFAPNGDDAQRG
jgi:hypothetical protein